MWDIYVRRPLKTVYFISPAAASVCASLFSHSRRNPFAVVARDPTGGVRAQARKADLRRIPEQAVLSEVRRMVEQMQALNRQLEETEATIEEYFKPIDKSAEIIMNMQLQKDEMQAKEMLKVMQEQVMIQREMAQKKLEVNSANVSHPAPEKESMPSNQEHLKRKHQGRNSTERGAIPAPEGGNNAGADLKGFRKTGSDPRRRSGAERRSVAKDAAFLSRSHALPRRGEFSLCMHERSRIWGRKRRD
ncbi:hypothetical protein MUK42_15784 [Musa troglodytarum]|uniref:Uncharacterized protein n=1 Tax=Musa troglodytarum TaxID=320322 RepID=A0A9E7HYM6_9LILI|nr:hypothetical protein MUK42_15784 [Musa troglodytarum]